MIKIYDDNYVVLKKNGITVKTSSYLNIKDFIVSDNCGELFVLRTDYCAITKIFFINSSPKRYNSNDGVKTIFEKKYFKVLEQEKIAEILVELAQSDKIKKLFLDNSKEACTFIFEKLCN